jgi:hypothetical protein
MSSSKKKAESGNEKSNQSQLSGKLERILQDNIKRYRKAGKSNEWIKSYERGFR